MSSGIYETTMFNAVASEDIIIILLNMPKRPEVLLLLLENVRARIDRV